MKLNGLRSVVAGSLIALNAGVSFASSGFDILIDKLAEQEVLSPGDARQLKIELQEEMRSELARGKVATLPAWIQNISMKGDLRLRHQYDWSGAGDPRIRERLRLRVGFDTRVTDSFGAGFGFATGGEKTAGASAGAAIIDAEPTSTNHTFGNGFAKSMLMVDFAYLDYRPLSWLTVTGGKMKAGTQLWNATDLLWDGDINPDGIAVNVQKDLGENLSVFGKASWLVMNENAGTEDPTVYIVEPGVQWTASEKVKVTGALAYQQFNVTRLNTGYYGTLPADVKAINPSLSVVISDLAGDYGLTVFGDYVKNNDSSADEDNTGSACGVTFGDAKVNAFGTWQLTFMQRRLEANAWIPRLGDSDFNGGTLNAKGAEIIFTCGLGKSTSFGIDYYAADNIKNASRTTDKSLIQFDIVRKF